MTRDDLLFALQHPNVVAFLRVIRQGESNQNQDAYTIRFGGSHFDAPPWAHPREAITVGRLTSTAAGAYQFLWRTWSALVTQYGFPDFSPQCQDEAAVALIAGRKALELVKEGRFHEATARCAPEWASLPGSQYGQPTQKIAQALEVFRAYGGTLATQTKATPERKDMIPVPLIVAGVQALSELIPAISSIFKPGSEVAARNVQAAQVIFDTVSKATGQQNVMAAIEQMQADPQALQAAKEAVHEVLPQLIESGGGGIDGARKAAANADQLPFYKQPAVLFVASTLPLVYAIVGAVVLGWGGRDFSDEVKVMVVTAILGLLGTAGAYFLGSSNSSQKKDAALAAAAK